MAHKMSAWDLASPHKTHATCTWESRLCDGSCARDKLLLWKTVMIQHPSFCVLPAHLFFSGSLCTSEPGMALLLDSGIVEELDTLIRVPDWSLKWELCSVFVLCSASEGQRGPWFLEFVAEILCHLFFFHSYVTWIVGSSPMWHDIFLLLLFGYYSSIYLLPCGNIYFGECVLLPTWGCSDSCLVLGSYCLECSNMLVFCPYPFASFLILRRSLTIFKDCFYIMQ